MKQAIVTGGTQGIGLAIAEILLCEGYYVTLTYAHNARAAEECITKLIQLSDNFEIVKADQNNKNDMQQLTKHILKKGRVDCIVCNAGTTLRKGLTEITNEEWEQEMHTNVNSNLFLIRDLFSIIKPNSRIIFIGSAMAIYPHATSISYGVTKAALHALAKNLVKCFEGTGTTVNAIAPGFVETEWQKNKPQEIRDNICNKTALKRFAHADEIACAVKFCINNQFVNGSIIEVNGGYNFK